MRNLSDSDFELFGLNCTFALDKQALTKAYLQLQSEMHPDRFANGTDAEKRMAVQWATRINEAYKRLQNPIERAIYWCELHGQSPRSQQSTLPTSLLIQQMDWRERLDEATDMETVEALHNEVMRYKNEMLDEVANAIDSHRDVYRSTIICQALMFIEKIESDLNKRLEKLEDAR